MHAESNKANIIAIAVFVDQLCIHKISHNTNMTNKRNTVKILLTLPPVKMMTKSQFSRPCALSVLRTNCYSIRPDCDKDFIFHTPVGNIRGHI